MKRDSQRRGRSVAEGIPIIHTRSPTPVLNDPSFSSWENQAVHPSPGACNHLALPQVNVTAKYDTPVERDYIECEMADDYGNGDGCAYGGFQTRSTASDSHSQTQPNLDAFSSQLYQACGDGSQHDQPFYSDEASTSNHANYHSQMNLDFSYLSDFNQGEALGFSQQDLQGVQGQSPISPNAPLEDCYQISEITAQMLEHSTVNDPESLQMAATLADQSDDPWSQLRIPQDSREQLWHGLQETQTRLYYDAAMASAPDDSNLSLDNNYGPLHGSQSELEAFPQDPSIGVRSPGINSYNHEASDGGRRRGGRQRGSHLPAETANNARTVRQVGSCLRCMTLREQCSGGSPCRKCSDIASNQRNRKWKGCYRSFAELAATLSPGFGENIEIIGMEFIPKMPGASDSRAVYADGEGLATTTYRKSGLPVVPTWKNRGETGQMLSRWLKRTVTDGQSIKKWLRSCFPCGRAYWTQFLLGTMWSYTMRCFNEGREDGNDLNGILLRAWKMTLVVTCLSIRIVVPEDATKTILNNLRHYQCVEENPPVNSSRLINRGIKHLFLDIYRQLVENVLSDMDKFVKERLSSIKERAWGHMLCVSILLVVVISQVQISLVDNLILSREDGRDQLEETREETLEALENLEAGASNIIQVFHGKHNRAGTRSADSRNGHALPLHDTSRIQDGNVRQLVCEIQAIKQQYKRSM
ncbi:hypothetical protein T310_0816 [Rasamsonia emersonii CBS 393.64]|uniref:Zn(2)-C6 fungal-type domain-containing protein n=1 Tax=Rasamsonia emersonii (strain ATCC 16479 / CBS 393.64 / IMI 116815) TaxID=1408163 RepID=A0A0F4Z4U1_RASE3|nr:hypothetical protein T310_0816 [Rasamsonia emersonii CBS 393.64]KKA25111.1 hypothetical protein T310_0816 [Rasamsonia emersonii CBS 393.64]